MLLGGQPKPETEALHSPKVQATAAVPPALIARADNDATVDLANSLLLATALRRAGGALDLHLLAQGGHAFVLDAATEAGVAWPDLAHTWMIRLPARQRRGCHPPPHSAVVRGASRNSSSRDCRYWTRPRSKCGQAGTDTSADSSSGSRPHSCGWCQHKSWPVLSRCAWVPAWRGLISTASSSHVRAVKSPSRVSSAVLSLPITTGPFALAATPRSPCPCPTAPCPDSWRR